MNMNYFDDEIKTTMINVVLGIIVGYASFALNNALASLAAAVIIFSAASFLLKNWLKMKTERKMLVSGAFVFALAWIISWTVLYNL